MPSAWPVSPVPRSPSRKGGPDSELEGGKKPPFSTPSGVEKSSGFLASFRRRTGCEKWPQISLDDGKESLIGKRGHCSTMHGDGGTSSVRNQTCGNRDR